MTSQTASRREEALAMRLGSLGHLSRPVPSPDEWARIAGRLERKRSVPVSHWPLLAAALVLLAVGGAVFLRSTPITYRVQGGAVNGPEFIAAKEKAATLTFSEGTELVLERGAVGRVVEVTERGARITLESGRLKAAVRHLQDSAWSVKAGPYTVRVTGTRFDVHWDSPRGEMLVAVQEGSVEVTGPLIDPGIRVAANQQLRARVHESEVRVEALQLAAPSQSVDPAAATADDGAGARSSDPRPPIEGEGVEAGASPGSLASVDSAPAEGGKASREGGTASTGTIQVARRAPVKTWSELVASGKYREVLKHAREMDMERALSGSSSSDLAALADAARYAGEPALARRALLTQRKRFPNSSAAALAAFLLGRTSEDSQSVAEALAWYDAYLREAPAGRYAGSALGRRMLLLERSDPSGAAKVAAQYLNRFPNGNYAEQAKRLRLSR